MTPIEKVAEIYEMFGKQDIEGVVGQFHENIQFDVTPNDSTHRKIEIFKPRQGKQQAAGFFTHMGENYDFKKFDVVNLMGGNNQVSALIDLEMVYKPNGNSIAERQLHLWTFDESLKVVEYEHFCDTGKWEKLTK
eukprot:NODE_18_length_47517_cov_0.674814.p25 type:complete len:135 gc:universal NODE_18_length_47517_cov_0.674814:38339-37935(-)